MQRDQLADEEARERLVRCPARPEQPLLRADEADGEALRGERGKLGQEVGLRLRVGDHEIGPPQRRAVEGEQRPRREAAGPEAPPVGDERVRERDERVEDQRSPARGPPRGRHVRVTGVADGDRVEIDVDSPQQSRLCEREPERGARTAPPLLLASLPHRLVPLDDLDAGPSEARDDLRVTGISALVRPEVQNTHYSRTSSTSACDRSRSPTRSACWLVIISPIRPSERNWIPTTTSRTPRMRSGRPPIACPSTLRTLR